MYAKSSKELQKNVCKKITRNYAIIYAKSSQKIIRKNLTKGNKEQGKKAGKIQ